MPSTAWALRSSMHPHFQCVYASRVHPHPQGILILNASVVDVFPSADPEILNASKHPHPRCICRSVPSPVRALRSSRPWDTILLSFL
eukprot:scaffold37099_cov19-Tisochrysis_lutea.AAC.3